MKCRCYGQWSKPGGEELGFQRLNTEAGEKVGSGPGCRFWVVCESPPVYSTEALESSGYSLGEKAELWAKMRRLPGRGQNHPGIGTRRKGHEQTLEVGEPAQSGIREARKLGLPHPIPSLKDHLGGSSMSLPQATLNTPLSPHRGKPASSQFSQCPTFQRCGLGENTCRIWNESMD